MRLRTGWALTTFAFSCAAAIAACVGDDPTTPGGSTGSPDGGDVTDGGGGEATLHPTDGSSGGDAPVAASCDPMAAFGTATPVNELNGIGTSQDARLSSDGLVMYFSAAQTDAGGDYDLYTAQRAAPSGPFSNLTKIPAAKQVNFIEAAPSVTGDGLVLYFAGQSTVGNGYAIYSDTRANLAQKFVATPPHFLGAPIDVIGDAGPFANNGYPFIREDGAELFFTSTRNGNTHIFRAAATADGGFTSAAPVDELNIGQFMVSPILSPDGLVVYFASDLAPDGGVQQDYDIFMATRAAPSGTFSNVHRVADLSTAYDDYPSYVTKDLCTIYLHRRQTGSIETIYTATKSP